MAFAYKYGEPGEFEKGLLANANCGGENVHRGIVLGAILGAAVGVGGIPDHLRTGLKHHARIHAQVEAFVEAVVGSSADGAKSPSHGSGNM